ncbi:MAG: 3D domain-containing protein, partial [Candidatus Saccharibacteria bacterium]
KCKERKIEMRQSTKVLKYVISIIILFVGVTVTPGTAAASTIRPTLSIGDRGIDIKTLQSNLSEAGYDSGGVDGVFGKQTLAAVARLQENADILIDGRVGPQTRGVLANLTGSNSEEISQTGNRVVNMVATAYDDSDECNYPFGGYPSFIGLPLRVGIVAVDPSFIPLGTKLYVQGYGEAIAADTGGAIKGNRIDLFYPTHKSASDFGIQNVKVYILD